MVRLRIYLNLRDSKIKTKRVDKESKKEKESKNCKILALFIEIIRRKMNLSLIQLNLQ